MSGNSTGSVLGGVSSVAGIAALPETGGNIVHQIIIITTIVLGLMVLLSMTLSRMYRKYSH